MNLVKITKKLAINPEKIIKISSNNKNFIITIEGETIIIPETELSLAFKSFLNIHFYE